MPPEPPNALLGTLQGQQMAFYVTAVMRFADLEPTGLPWATPLAPSSSSP